MIVGVPKEIKNEEYRVAVTPNGVKEFVRAGHTVIVEKGAGVGSGFDDAAYKAAGASMAKVEDVFAKADMIVKVKEPLPQRVADVQEGPDPLHVPAPRRGLRQGAHRGHARGRHPRHRLRDRRAAQRRAPAAPAR